MTDTVFWWAIVAPTVYVVVGLIVCAFVFNAEMAENNNEQITTTCNKDYEAARSSNLGFASLMGLFWAVLGIMAVAYGIVWLPSVGLGKLLTMPTDRKRKRYLAGQPINGQKKVS